jgi:2-methylisocitrate lyase-like PEP mutase family enzyme
VHFLGHIIAPPGRSGRFPAMQAREVKEAIAERLAARDVGFGYGSLAAGADILFVEAPETTEQMLAINERFAARVPLLANMVEGGKTPLGSVEQLGAMGYRIVIFPGGLVRTLSWAAREYFASLKAHGSSAAFANRMFDFKGLQGMLGTEAMLAEARQYDPDL